MKIVFFVVLLVAVVSVLGDCGCLKCGKNLRVVSRPCDPVTVVYRGELCHYPRPIPYRIEVPNPEYTERRTIPLRSYGYRVDQIRVNKPEIKDPVLYEHGYKVEVPQPGLDNSEQRYREYKYLVNLVAKPDRVVMNDPHAYMGYRMPKPCGPGPIIQYLTKSRNKRQIRGDWMTNLQPKSNRFFRFFEKPTTKIKKLQYQSGIESDSKHDSKREKNSTNHFQSKDKSNLQTKKAERSSSSQDNPLAFGEVFEQLGVDDNQILEDDVGRRLKKDGKSISPKDQLFYFINLPIRALDFFGNVLGFFQYPKSTRSKRALSNLEESVLISKLKPKPPVDIKDLKNKFKSRIRKPLQISENSIKKQTEMVSQVPFQTIKNKVKETLWFIQTLLRTDFSRNEAIYTNLLGMENLKNVIMKEWRINLEKHKYNDITIKINILHKMKELLSEKDDVVEAIVEYLIEESKSFNTRNLIKTLVRLQKLQCILGKSVEEFEKMIKHGTPVDVPKEINHLGLLEKIDLIETKNQVDLLSNLKEQRDLVVEKERYLLDNLKKLLGCEKSECNTDKINQVAKIIWETNNIAKMQKETLIETHERIQDGKKIQRELKIIFDLQKHLEACWERTKAIFQEINKEKL